ncbi:zinc-dependent alcohol dehydrogenase family protein [Leifsonia sp. NPDC080035]|uniref:Zinc-dependent alcohol dehydrogenase family protein n=1 Tax=Leifsonia sp. NPDC080035 TaxID=3143936 RepID=A0AAU7GEU5_9MICO
MSRVVVFDRFGGPEVLHVVDEEAPVPSPGEVGVRVEATAVNPIDAMMRAGASPAPVPLPHARLGIEATGIVEAVGDGVAGVAVGDAVIVTAIPDAHRRGSYADRITVAANSVIPRPAELTVPEAAAVWVAFSTAFGALVEVGGMRPGERVVISGASGGVGRAAIQLANRIGAEPIAVTRRSARVSELRAAGAAEVVATDEVDLVDAVREITGGAGADIALDLVRGPGQRELIRALRPSGSLVAAGFLDSRPTPPVEDPTVRVANYRGFGLLSDTAAVARMAASLNDGVRAGAFRPAVDTVVPLERIVEAHERFERGENGGRKIVVTTV